MKWPNGKPLILLAFATDAVICVWDFNLRQMASGVLQGR
jgi:hypothetical protein